MEQHQWKRQRQLVETADAERALGSGLPVASRDGRMLLKGSKPNRRNQMRIAAYVRVSGQRQVQTQTIEQQLERLQVHCQNQSWSWQEVQIFRDDGYSGASLKRPGLDRLRDQVCKCYA